MKTKYWIILLSAVLALCLGLSALLLNPGEASSYAQITREGQVLKTVDLRIPQTFTIEAEDGGYNVICVEDGKIGIIEATCPDHYCMHRGMLNSGAQIVCLPNRLVITFVGEPEIDGVAG